VFLAGKFTGHARVDSLQSRVHNNVPRASDLSSAKGASAKVLVDFLRDNHHARSANINTVSRHFMTP